MAIYARAVSTKKTPQTQPAFGLPQVENNAGGFVFSAGAQAQLERFLILGSEGGSYYVSPKKLTVENAKNALACLLSNPSQFISTIVAVSDEGRAPKNDAAIFCLALAAHHTEEEVRRLAFWMLPKVCRTGTHLFQFMANLAELRGHAPGASMFRGAISRWYHQKDSGWCAYQMLKYQQREGWSHRDLLRLAHPKPRTDAFQALFHWVVKGDVPGEPSSPSLPKLINGFQLAKFHKDEPKVVAKLVREFGLTREMIPTECLNSPEVWDALLDGMPLHALVRNLGNMSKVGILGPFSEGATQVVAMLGDQGALRKSRLHPFSILVAMRTYSQGHGMLGKGKWEVNQRIVDALDDAFYLAFENVEPTGKRLLLALDVSGSMDSPVPNLPLSAREVAGAMAMTFLRREGDVHPMGFTHGLVDLKLTPKMRLDAVCAYMRKLDFGGTDCALPWELARQRKWSLDGVLTITDNETWSGGKHVFQAIRDYRRELGRATKSVILATSSNNWTINDPSDPLGLDVVGIDTSVPEVVSTFLRS